MRTITNDIYVDTTPQSDRSLAPQSEVERFMTAKTFGCILLAARISAEQCAINRKMSLHRCGKCTQTQRAGLKDKPAATGVTPTRRPKRRKGDNPDSPWRDNPVFIPQAARKRVLS